MRREFSIHLFLPIAVAGYGVLALLSPGNFVSAGLLAIAAAFMALAYLFPATFLGAAILALELGPEYQLSWFLNVPNDVTVAAYRLVILLAVAVYIWRYGFARRPNPPVAALLTMFLISLFAADFLPVLTSYQMFKSLIGLMLGFLFLHCVFRREVIERYLNLVVIMPLISAICGLIVQAIGGYPALDVDFTGALRLGGMTEPPYLGHFAYAAFFVSVHQYITAGRRGHLLLAGINLVILLATAARTPIAMAPLLAAAVMLFVPQPSFAISARVKVAVAAAILLTGALFVFLPQIEQRFAGNTESYGSGREYIWPYYLAAIDKNPWFGRGIGSGVLLLDTIDDYRINVQTPHNEYLRITMDAGIVGLLIFVVAMVRWVISELHFMRREERVLFLGFMLTFALASFVDNTLSSPITLVYLFALTLVIQCARQRRTGIPRPPALDSGRPVSPVQPPQPRSSPRPA